MGVDVGVVNVETVDAGYARIEQGDESDAVVSWAVVEVDG
jgi:hypothetical protein